jgi:hypothetical protein
LVARPPHQHQLQHPVLWLVMLLKEVQRLRAMLETSWVLTLRPSAPPLLRPHMMRLRLLLLVM